MTYKVYLTNFGTVTYEGSSMVDAILKAECNGFESVMIMTKSDGSESVHSWSPISGWRS